MSEAAHQRVLDSLEKLGLGHPHILGQVPGQVDHGHCGLEALNTQSITAHYLLQDLKKLSDVMTNLEVKKRRIQTSFYTIPIFKKPRILHTALQQQN